MSGSAGGVTLLSNEAATGAQKQWLGGRGTFAVCGTFGGATVKLQFLGPDNTTWIDAGTECTLTADGAGNFDLPPVPVRAKVTGGAPAALFCEAIQLEL